MSKIQLSRILGILLISLSAGIGIIDAGILALSHSQGPPRSTDSQLTARVQTSTASNRTGGAGPSWDGSSLWNLNNVNNSTLTFLSNTTARFSNFQFSWPPAVSIVSKENWTVQSSLVLEERVRAWNFSNVNGGFAWQTALNWGTGSAVMGYGRDDADSPNTGIVIGGECIASVLTSQNFLGQWLTLKIALEGPTQMMNFSLYGPDGLLVARTVSQGSCGTRFGTQPVNVEFFTASGIADLDWIRVTSGDNVVFFDDFLNGQPRLLASSSPYSWTFDDGNTAGWTPVVGWNLEAGHPEYPQSCKAVNGEYSLTKCEPAYRVINFTDFVIEAQVRVINAASNSIWGIGFRWNPAGAAYANVTKTTGDPYTLAQGYSFEFIGSTAYLYKCVDPVTVVCTVLASAPTNNSTGFAIYAVNTLKVVAIGSDIKLFLNWAQIMEANDSQFSSGLVSLFSIPDGVTSNFDNVAIIPVSTSQGFFDDFAGSQLASRWIVENMGGNYTLGHSLLTLSTNGPSITLYRPFVPTTPNFTLSARVESRLLAAFALRIQAGPPQIFGSTLGAQLEFDSGVENKNFLAAWEPAGGGWSWSTFYIPSAIDTWYTLQMVVQETPFTIIYSVFNDTGVLLGSYTTTAMGFNYTSIQYVCLEAWSAPLSYSVDWVSATESVASPSSPTFFDDFNGSQLSPNWIITPYQTSSQPATLAVSHGILHMKSIGNADMCTDYYPPFNPSNPGMVPCANQLQMAVPLNVTGSSVSVTVRVMANSAGRFEMALTDRPSTDAGHNLAAISLDLAGECGDGTQMGGKPGIFNATGSTYGVLSCAPTVGIWYRLQILATNSTVTFNLLNDAGSVIATTTTRPSLLHDTINPQVTYPYSLSNVHYLALMVYCGWNGCNSDYNVDWISARSPAVDFNITASPVSPSVPVGSDAISTVNLSSVGGFFGNVMLSAAALDPIAAPGAGGGSGGGRPLAMVPLPCGLTVTLSRSTVFVARDGTGESILNVSAPACASAGLYPLIVNASQSGLIHSILLTVTVGASGGSQPATSSGPNSPNGSVISQILQYFAGSGTPYSPIILIFGVLGSIVLIILGLAKSRHTGPPGLSKARFGLLPRAALGVHGNDPVLMVLFRR